MTTYCPSPLLMHRPANINTTLHYPILSLPSNLVQPSSPSLSRSRQTKKQSSSFSSTAASHTSTSSPAAPSRLAAFLASLLPLPASASSADHERVKHRHCSDLSFPASCAATLERLLSSADLTPFVSLSFTRCAMDAPCVDALMRGLASHTALQSLSFEQCGDAIDALLIVRQLHTLPAVTSLSFRSTSLSNLHKHDMHAILSMPALVALNVASSALPLHSQQSIVSSLSSPSSRLTHLDLSNTGCDMSVAQLLASSLPSNTHLTSLTLHSNRLGRDGVLALCSSLSSNKALSYLDLRWNRLFTRPAPEAASSQSSVASVSLDALVSLLQSNTSLTSLLLCGHADPAASNLQSAVDIFTQRNKTLKQPQQSNNNSSNSHAAAATTSHLSAATAAAASHHAQGKKDSLSIHDNPLQLSPPLESRSYSHSLSSAATPFSLSLEPVASPSAASDPVSSPTPHSPPHAPSSAVDARLSSVVLEQEQQIARHAKMIGRLRAIVKKQEETLKTTKAQLRNNQRLTPPLDASPPLPPRPTTPRTPASHPTEPWTPLSAASSDAGAGVSVSPPLSASPRGSFTLEGGVGASVGAVEEEEGGGSREFRVNLDLAATVVLLEQQKSAQERLMEEMRQSIKAQEAAAAAAQPLSASSVDGEQQHESSPSGSAATSSSDAATSVTGVLRTRDDERGRLVAEVADLRHQLAQLQHQTTGAARPTTPGLRRDSANHTAAVLAAARMEGERAVKERDDKIQALLSAQRVLAESKEVQLAALRREWRDKEKEWKEERDRMKEEIRRLRRRNNRLSNDPKRDRLQAAVNTAATTQQQPNSAGSAVDAVLSPSSESSSESSSDSSDEDHGSTHIPPSSSQPPPTASSASSSRSSLSSTGPALPNKPAHSLGLVIAARIAAFEAHNSADESGRTKQARSVEEPKRDRKKGRRERKREADEAVEDGARQSKEQGAVEHQHQHRESGKEAQEEKVAS